MISKTVKTCKKSGQSSAKIFWNVQQVLPQVEQRASYEVVFPQEITEMLSRCTDWKWLLFCCWCSLRPICNKFVDDETSKHTWIAKGEIIRHAVFPRFSLPCESSETGSAPDWTLPSLTSAVISHGCWLSNNDCLSRCLSAAQRPLLSLLIGTHIFAQDHIKLCSRLPLQGIMGIWVPCHRRWQGLCRRSIAKSNTNMGSKIDWKNHSNTRGWPWSAASPLKARVNTSLSFSLPSFRFSLAPLFCSRWRTEREAPSPGPHHSLPPVPKEAGPNTKAAVIAILHSPTPS